MNTQLRDFLYACIFLVLFFTLLLWVNDSCASEEDHADFWYYTSQGMIVADWLTTRDCADKDWCYEANPITRSIVGRDINKRALDILIVLELIGNHYLQKTMTTKHRLYFNMAHTLTRYGAVSNNISLGLRIQF